MLPSLPVAHAAQGRQIRIQIAAPHELAHFIKKTAREHRIEARFDASMQLCAMR